MEPSANVYFPKSCFWHNKKDPSQRSPDEYLILPLPSIMAFFTYPTQEKAWVMISAYPSRELYKNFPRQISPFLKISSPWPSISSFVNQPLYILQRQLLPKVNTPLPLRRPSFIYPSQMLPSPYSTLHLPFALPSLNCPMMVNSLKVSTSFPLPLNLPSLKSPQQYDLFLNLQTPVPFGSSFFSSPSQESPFLKTISPLRILQMGLNQIHNEVSFIQVSKIDHFLGMLLFFFTCAVDGLFVTSSLFLLRWVVIVAYLVKYFNGSINFLSLINVSNMNNYLLFLSFVVSLNIVFFSLFSCKISKSLASILSLVLFSWL